MQEALRLAADGEIAYSDAIRLLEQSPRPDDLRRRVLDRFGAVMTPQAKSKLTLAAWVPLPDEVDNHGMSQSSTGIRSRQDLHDRERHGCLDEVQYYNGRWCNSTASAPTSRPYVTPWPAAATGR